MCKGKMIVFVCKHCDSVILSVANDSKNIVQQENLMTILSTIDRGFYIVLVEALSLANVEVCTCVEMTKLSEYKDLVLLIKESMPIP